MPAAAVIPAPIAYIKVVAVKKLVVGFVGDAFGGARHSLRSFGVDCKNALHSCQGESCRGH